MLVFAIEWVFRGDLGSTVAFFMQTNKPGWTTILVFALVLYGLDAIAGRNWLGMLIVAPVTLALAFIGYQKSLYLGDPLFPTDILFARQIFELLPLLIGERPWAGMALAIAPVLAMAALFYIWRFIRLHVPRIGYKGRIIRLILVLPMLAFFASLMDYGTFSWTRDRLQIIPMMWDQKENYASNGFTLAFALNVPMAHVSAPNGYSAKAIESIARPEVNTALPDDYPDIIMVMSESFWDAGKLPGITITPDPISSTRRLQSGEVFSPEFGGMTANVEFEALTGFSNAFLPAGSIPYQQYIRKPLPSLASFLGSQGYQTLALHPGTDWFWNRNNAYKALGFDEFRFDKTMAHTQKRGKLVSDTAMTDEIISTADIAKNPLFLFAVSLQNHGPYEANRYGDAAFDVQAHNHNAISDRARASLASYAQGAADADHELQRLIDWAQKRERPTIIAFFGDHLPPLGPTYVETGFLKTNVAPRKDTPQNMLQNRSTPLVIWSNRSGSADDMDALSPAFLPLHVLKLAGISHPYYTGFLGDLYRHYHVVERSLLLSDTQEATTDWAQAKHIAPPIRNFHHLQYDMMFGKQYAAPVFFPETVGDRIASAN
ncbi:LTA synthase family protein [Aquamicrobium segne]|uniref:LTA synthase family protein n=1 Tax=Aquamicrobium segne TaxID=469547 RepID=A0ABW0GSL8_9HYPH